jgi:hypothetical protein
VNEFFEFLKEIDSLGINIITLICRSTSLLAIVQAIGPPPKIRISELILLI